MNKKFIFLGFILAFSGLAMAMDNGQILPRPEVSSLEQFEGSVERSIPHQSDVQKTINGLINTVIPLLKPWAQTDFERSVMRQAVLDRWQQVWAILQNNKRFAQILLNPYMKQALFVAFAKKIVADKLQYLDGYNNELITIATQLGLQIPGSNDAGYPAALAFILQSARDAQEPIDLRLPLDASVNDLQSVDAQIRTLKNDKPGYFGYPETSAFYKKAFATYKEREHKLLEFRKRTISIIKVLLDSGAQPTEQQMKFLKLYGFKTTAERL